MKSVYFYSNYREYLLDFYKEKKKKNPHFSYLNFSRKAGYRTKGFFYTVLNGQKNLSKKSLINVAQAVGLNKSETEYFETLVFFNQATDLVERTYFFEKLNAIKTVNIKVITIQETRKDQYEFYSKWYHSAIRSLIGMYPFKNDFTWLADNVCPALTVGQAKESVSLLEKLGLIKKQSNGYYRLTDNNITTGNEIAALAALNFHKEATRLVEHALNSLPKEKRNITGLTLGISENAYKEICEEIALCRKKVVSIANNDEGADRTYQLYFHFFPITKIPFEKRKTI
jgi:uncharacterized protein (TIGR02147 family)